MSQNVSSMGISLYAEYLNRQGISARDAEVLGLVALDPKDVSENVGFRCYSPGVFIPYPGSDYFRVRVLGALRTGAPKYLSPKGSGSAPCYFPPCVDWSDICADVSKAVCITEGEFKSWTASRAGVPTIGVGGVDMQAGLFEGGIEWKGRKVLICFDKDEGYVTGDYKPGVMSALGRLANRLGRVGAQVWVLNIPGEIGMKLGLDDYLRAGGDWDTLLSGAVLPPEWCEELEYLNKNCIYVVGTDWTHVYNLEDRSRKGVDDFHAAHISRIRYVDDKVQQLSRVWQRSRERITVRGYDLDPRGGYGVWDGASGPVINLWTPYPTWPSDGAGVLEDWEKYMRGLFGEHVEWIRSWVGHMLTKPWERTNQAVLLRTKVQGIGKSLFGEIVGELVGRAHWSECPAERMFDRFNSEMEGKVWVVVNELDAAFNSHESRMNDLLSQETMQIEHKGKNKYALPNYRRWYMTANSAKPCTLSPNQRRVLVIHPELTLEDTRGEWGQWVGSRIAGMRRDAGALGEIHSWFASAPGLEGWVPTAPVPYTEEAQELSEGSMTGVQIAANFALQWMLAGDGWGAVRQDNKQAAVRLFAELRALVKAHGGQVTQKQAKEDGKVTTYTVFEMRDKAEKIRMSNGGYRTLREVVAVQQIAQAMWLAVRSHVEGAATTTKW